MTITFHEQRLRQFLAIPFEHQTFAYAKAPQNWVRSMALEGVDFADILPAAAQSREDVRRLCRNEDFPLMYRYICVMAWGNQGAGKSRKHAQRAWGARERLTPILAAIAAGACNRAEAYALFCGVGAVAGLGPSYFTKLIYFFWPDERCYIMDQWTAKSINYLYGEKLVPMTGSYVATSTDGKHYERYCQAVELLAGLTDVRERLSGSQTEMRLFCRGGRSPGPWRKIIREHDRLQATSNKQQIMITKTIPNEMLKLTGNGS